MLQGRVILLTGVGPGMGRSVALALARQGAALALGARTEARLHEVAREVAALGVPVLARSTDLTDPVACQALVDEAVARFGRLDGVVQNGHHEGDWSTVEDAVPASWREVMDVNFFGALHLVQSAIPRLREGGGSIVLVNSGAAVRAPATMGAYSASKAALASLTCTLANELGRDQVRVNGVYLGPVLGDNLLRAGGAAAAAAGTSLDAWLESKAAELPLQEVPTPDQCAGIVVFLCSELAAAVTGQNIAVNGGQWTTQ
jgi:NAD(P)-dependent dehydrogenase (short-subunit alcohol dehydrogenase family)